MTRLTISHDEPRSLRSGFLANFLAICAEIGHARRRAQTIRRLRGLNDHQLRDIGLERGALEHYEVLNGDPK